MPQFKNIVEILNLLEKSNCRKCNEPTCTAFAASVLMGKRQLSECPQVSPGVLETYGVQERKVPKIEKDMDQLVQDLKDQVKAVALPEAAKRIGSDFNGKKLTVKVLGKPFSVDGEGNIYTDLHVNPWLAIPFLSYVLKCQGAPLTGNWVSMRELEGGKDWHHFFSHQCVTPMKEIADTYTDLFEDMVDIFNGQPVGGPLFQSDISIVLYPLPLVPMLICYWKPEEGMPSDLKIFFDADAEKNLNIESIYSLGTGMVTMFGKLARTHGIR